MASAQAPSEEAQKKAEQFFHHDKADAPPVDPNFGKKPAKSSGERQEEHKKQREEEAKTKNPPTERDVERSVKNSLQQADQYGREMSIEQTLPQTLTEEQNPFGGHMNSPGKAGMNNQ